MGSDMGRYAVDPNEEIPDGVTEGRGRVLLEIIDKRLINGGRETSPMAFRITFGFLAELIPVEVEEAAMVLLRGLIELLETEVLVAVGVRRDLYELGEKGYFRYVKIRNAAEEK